MDRKLLEVVDPTEEGETVPLVHEPSSSTTRRCLACSATMAQLLCEDDQRLLRAALSAVGHSAAAELLASPQAAIVPASGANTADVLNECSSCMQVRFPAGLLRLDGASRRVLVRRGAAQLAAVAVHCSLLSSEYATLRC